MTDRELMQMALDALEHGLPIIEDFGAKEQLQIQHKAIAALYEALRAALAQPEPEELAQLEQAMIEAWKPIPQREWQGLTDEEIEKCYLGSFDEGQFARAIEAKLREKNT